MADKEDDGFSWNQNNEQLLQDLVSKANQYAEEYKKSLEDVSKSEIYEWDLACTAMVKHEELMDQFDEWIKEIIKSPHREGMVMDTVIQASEKEIEGSALARIETLIESFNEYVDDFANANMEKVKKYKRDLKRAETILESMLSRLSAAAQQISGKQESERIEGSSTNYDKQLELRLKMKEYGEQVMESMKELVNGGDDVTARTVLTEIEGLMQNYAEFIKENTKPQNRETLMKVLEEQKGGSKVGALASIQVLIQIFKQYVKEYKAARMATEENRKEERDLVQNRLDKLSEVAQRVIDLKDKKNP